MQYETALHEISETELLEFVDRCCPTSAAERVVNHVANCEVCRETVEAFSVWRNKLIEAGAELRCNVAVSEDRIDQMLAETRIHIAQWKEAAEWTPAQAVLLLRSVLEPFCGVGTAKAAVALALRRSTSGHSTSSMLDRAGWGLFVENLSESVESICGRAAGRLVGQAGITLAVWGQA